MKVRDSGMPDEATWDRFFDPREILDALSFDNAEANVVDFGCGYGTFTIAAARRTSGMVYGIDIDPTMIAATRARAAKLALDNVTTVLRDFVADGTGLPDGIADYAMLFNILHAENPQQLLDEARRLLRPRGRLAVIHWIVDAATPRGPPLSIRPRLEDCQRWLMEASFELLVPHVQLPPWHYGIMARRPAGPNRGQRDGQSSVGYRAMAPRRKRDLRPSRAGARASYSNVRGHGSRRPEPLRRDGISGSVALSPAWN